MSIVGRSSECYITKMNEKFISVIITIWVYVASFVFAWLTTDSPRTSGFQGQRLLVQTKDCEIKSRITTTNYAHLTYPKMQH